MPTPLFDFSEYACGSAPHSWGLVLERLREAHGNAAIVRAMPLMSGKGLRMATALPPCGALDGSVLAGMRVERERSGHIGAPGGCERPGMEARVVHPTSKEPWPRSCGQAEGVRGCRGRPGIGA